MPRKLIGVLQTSGKQGPPGPEGKPGKEGVAGKGFPVGGLTNQILAKKSDADYDTEWVDNIGQVESVNGKTGQVTLTAEDVGATTEQWVNQQNYLKSIPSEYITETELESKGYLTEHQSLANYSTTEEMNNAISNHHDSTKQDTLTAGSNIKIENNVISATGGGGGGSLNIDNETIVQNEDGTISTVIGGKYVDGLVDGPTIVEITGTSWDVSSQITYDVMQTLINTPNLRANISSGFGKEYGCLVDTDTSTSDTYILTCNYTITTVKVVYTGTGTADNWSCKRGFVGGSSGFNGTSSFYALVSGKVPSPINSANFLPLSEDFTVDNDKLKLNWLNKTSKDGYYFNYNQSNNKGVYTGKGSLSGGFNAWSQGKNGICWGSNVGNQPNSTEVFMFGNQLYCNNGANSYSFATNMINYIKKGYSFVAGNFNNFYGSTFGEGAAVFGRGNSPASDWSFNTGKWSAFDNDKLYAHIVGNGTSNTERANAYTLDWSGNGTFAGTVSSSTGADYAEYFEWKDGNTENEDRIGYIVTLDGDKIVKATSGDDILGICSGTAMVLGDSAEWNWSKRYLTDDFGRIIYEDRMEHHEAIYNTDGELIKEAWEEEVHAPKQNPDYNISRTYIKRSERPEWQIVGMMGKLYVRDNGTCEVNGYATVDNGIAIKSTEKTNMRVMERVTENIVRVLLK